MPEPSTAARRPPADAGAPKVIYVMGAGRSGSTILGVALGNCANVFYAGELDKWLMRSGIPALSGAERTRFWGIVRGDVDNATDLFGHQARALERSSALFSVGKWRARRRLRGRYRRVTEELYRAIAHAAGATHIVDTSHYPLRARELQAIRGIEMYLVFLVRDPRSVVASFARHDVAERSFGMPTTNAYLWLTHMLSVFVFLRHPRDRRLLVRHEAFISNPEGILRDILDHVASSAPTPDFTSLNTGIPLQGNRLIAADVVTLKQPADPPPRRSWLTALLQLPWQAVFSALRPAAVAPRSGVPDSARLEAP
jgi:sulfotransferase family protein